MSATPLKTLGAAIRDAVKRSSSTSSRKRGVRSKALVSSRFFKSQSIQPASSSDALPSAQRPSDRMMTDRYRSDSPSMLSIGPPSNSAAATESSSLGDSSTS